MWSYAQGTSLRYLIKSVFSTNRGLSGEGLLVLEISFSVLQKCLTASPPLGEQLVSTKTTMTVSKPCSVFLGEAVIEGYDVIAVTCGSARVLQIESK